MFGGNKIFENNLNIGMLLHFNKRATPRPQQLIKKS
jgi:hypothetical protein